MKRLSRFMLFALVLLLCGHPQVAAAGPLPDRDGVLCEIAGPTAQVKLRAQRFRSDVANVSGERTVRPLLMSVTLPANPVPFGGPVDISTAFRNAHSGAAHRATIDWGDGSTTDVKESGSEMLRSHRYAPGVYTVAVTVTAGAGADCRSSSVEQTSYVVVYDSAAAYVTGNGRVKSDGRWCVVEDACTVGGGVARFGFVFGHRSGIRAPVGHTSVHFQDAGFTFRSVTHHRVHVSGAGARLWGSGWVNGVAGYEFRLTVHDGHRVRGSGTDRFAIRIWERASGRVVYDNERARISGGQIMVK